MNTHQEKIKSVIDELALVRESDFEYFSKKELDLPSRSTVIDIINSIRMLMFPKYCVWEPLVGKNDIEVVEHIFSKLSEQLKLAYSATGSNVSAEDIAYELVAAIPNIKRALIKDVQAIYEGDPAANSAEEVILSYPGFTAISVYRIAHEFYIRKIPYIFRIMTEYSHELTGIDIHAGATIGEYFFIDHGTGIVIGETTTIGDHVKIYQGVTLGAKSFELDEDGNPIKGIKRHPDIGNDCVIYANATILGGDTRIGDGCIIGANVWLTESVEPGKKVFYSEKKKG